MLKSSNQRPRHMNDSEAFQSTARHLTLCSLQDQLSQHIYLKVSDCDMKNIMLDVARKLL